MIEKKIEFPIANDSTLESLRAGDMVLLNGIIYTARDQAHKRLAGLIKKEQELPFRLPGNAIYYCGPTPPRNDGLFGSAGPTTSGRMDTFTGILMENGLKAAIGKGNREDQIRQFCVRCKAVYFITFGGAGAYLAKRITRQEMVAFPELGAEAVYKLEVSDFPVITAYDVYGSSIF